jgi:hypothetical protein
MARGQDIVGPKDQEQEVMAPFGDYGYYKGKWENIKVKRIGLDTRTPLEIRKSLVGLVVRTIFTRESIEKQTGQEFLIPPGCRLAYPSDVVKALQDAGKYDAAEKLRRLTTESDKYSYMYVFEKEIYEVV